MKTSVIYHNADFDGIFCREIAKKFLGTDGVEYIGWNFGDAKVQLPEDRQVYILDLSPDCLEVSFRVKAPIRGRIIWIDHHKPSIDKWPQDIPGYRIDGVAACRLAWQWFYRGYGGLREEIYTENIAGRLPTREEFLARTVQEPLAVRLSGEYDACDKRDTNADLFQYGLRSVDLDEHWWQQLVELGIISETTILISRGKIICDYARYQDESLVRSNGFTMEWEGKQWIALNSPRCNSKTFDSIESVSPAHDGMIAYSHNGKCWTVSLYASKNRPDLDVSEIAVKHGGGGHKGAAGFTCQSLPF